jgi:iron-sulfur cluster repair protein YtfE (RIC family)
MPNLAPRAFKLEELVPLLLSEHEAMSGTIRKIAILLDDGNFEEASEVSLQLRPLLVQHILDEESQVLKFLVEVQGRTLTQQAISVAQEHRKIFNLLGTIEGWKKLSYQELKEDFEQLSSLLVDHMMSEEEKVFPSVLRLLLAQQKESKPALLFNK